MRLPDLFCGAGGAAVGYHRAGFDGIVGVDVKPQPRFPFTFVQADAMTFALDGFDVIHASPPCQAFTTMSNRWRGKGGRADKHLELIAPIRERLRASGSAYVIENVLGAAKDMHSPALLTGAMFGLEVHRPRLFETSWLLLSPSNPEPRRTSLGVYGKLDGRLVWRRADGTELRAPKSLGAARAAMGIDWMEWDELKESIPPAYTEFIGRSFMAQRRVAA